jgi:Protein of unknown function (DUF3800)
MSECYVFADEAGNFDFSDGRDASRYFVLCTVMAEHCAAGDALLTLRRDLGWRGLHLDRVFHASEDSQAIRAEVFELLSGEDFWVDATIFDKRKAQSHLRSEASLYGMAWYLHFKYLAKQMDASDRLFVAASSLGTKKARGALHTAIDDVVRRLSPCRSHRVAFWPAESDPCLQVADYCTWAIQRKWERGDARSHALILPKIRSEFDVWRRGQTTYY